MSTSPCRLMPPLSRKFKLLLLSGKICLAAGMIGYLLYVIQGDEGFEHLIEQPKEWSFLFLAQLLVIIAFGSSFVRWSLLVRGMGMQFPITDALRLGSLGYMLNQIMPGSVGGDLFKAAFIAHEQPGRRTEAVASIFIDRVVGLVAMLLVASGGLLLTSDSLRNNELLLGLRAFVWTAALAGLLGILIMSSPIVTGKWIQQRLEKIPLIGHILTRLSQGLANFRSRKQFLAWAFVLALLTHSLLVTAFWCVSRGLPIEAPSFRVNATIVPLALVAGAMPLTPGGLGLTETGLAALYDSVGCQQSDGALVALCYRALTYVFASVGGIYYLSAKKRMDALMEEAEMLAEQLESEDREAPAQPG